MTQSDVIWASIIIIVGLVGYIMGHCNAWKKAKEAFGIELDKNKNDLL